KNGDFIRAAGQVVGVQGGGFLLHQGGLADAGQQADHRVDVALDQVGQLEATQLTRARAAQGDAGDLCLAAADGLGELDGGAVDRLGHGVAPSVLGAGQRRGAPRPASGVGYACYRPMALRCSASRSSPPTLNTMPSRSISISSTPSTTS